ncbi:porin [Pedobacter deserti]|uniref:porin n=1 Tax=Pedobacter deserti TaxID=2817382 RepID=UPI00210E531B|nr:porin [Pedobacter sp. SYSU D00382]
MKFRALVLLFSLLSFAGQLKAQGEGDEKPMKFNGMEFKSADSLFYINFRFRMQNRVGYYSNAPKELGVSEWDARVRRLRLRGDGYILGKQLGYSFQLSFSRGDQDIDNTGISNIVRDAVIFYNFSDRFYIAFGQNKLPGNRQRVNSSGQLQFAERSIVNSALTIDRDFGIKAYYNNFIGNAVYHIKGAISTGEGRSVNTTDKGLAYTGRVEFLPFGNFKNGGDYSEGDLEREEKPKLSIAGGYSFNKATTNTGGQLGEDLFSPVDMGTLMLDAIFKYQGWAFSVEHMNRQVDNPLTFNDDDELSYAFEGSGTNYQGSYVFRNNVETAFRYSNLKPSQDIAIYRNRREVLELGLSKYLRGHKVKAQLNINYNVDDNNFSFSNQDNNWGAIFQIELGI